MVKARTHLHDLERQRSAAQDTKSKAELEIQRWKEQHPMRARMAALGLSNPAYLTERESLIQSADALLETATPQIEQAKQTYMQARKEGLQKVEEKYRPQREWVDKAERTALQREREERMAEGRQKQLEMDRYSRERPFDRER